MVGGRMPFSEGARVVAIWRTSCDAANSTRILRIWTNDSEILRSHCSNLVGSFGGAVDGFDEGDAAAAFRAVAGGGAMVLDGLEKIFEDRLVAAEIADDGGGSAFVFV